jgi:hypothetical protein
MSRIVSCSQFSQFIVNQLPVFDKYIIKDIRPEDGWIAHVTGGTWEAWSGTTHIRDRFNAVFPNITKAWTPTVSEGCLGTPCDKNEHLIGWGSTRITEFLEEQSWQTPLLCFDQEMHITHAKEQFAYIISDILRPVVNWVQGSFIRKRGAQYVDNKFIANRNFGTTASNFVFNWVLAGPSLDEERFIDTNCPPTNVFKMTPQMLQRMVEPLLRIGYLGKNPFRETMPPMLELVTDTQTCWELDRLGGQQGIGGTPSISGNWRFTEWEAANKYWRYGFSGQIGNYAVRVDPFGLRFNYVGVVNGLYRYQVVLPYKNIASSGAGSQAGLKSVNNADFDNAQYAFSYIWHPRILELLTAQSEAVNPEMPFARRNWAGKWQFVMDNLGADVNGCVIENKRRNKGQFINDFKQAIAPDHTEFGVLIFHKREPSCVIEISTCNADPGYPVQSYSSSNTTCVDEHSGTSPIPGNTTLTFTPTLNSVTSTYEIAVDSVICEGGPVQHGAVTGTSTLATLVVQLNSVLDVMGTFAVASATTITLTGPCASASLPFLA